ncbi:response regulator transcription factor [Oceanobacillus jeddahense]|uniref:Response regulator transcription factor n=1 Tax=Oceanobacillus jeddahense TaxID=1462527 RepID=A0ABY5JQS3_9BACI|nr:response regulator transcription factor [Oceanobacillus jeddahense]UUI01207.1 response regulator transcription factor [Oceanobacillus jeddahense]
MRNKKILVVDDELEIAELMKDYLEEEQYEVKISTDGEECLAIFREYQPHLLVLDIMLPGVDGMEVCRMVRAESAIPIIMLSAKKSEIDKVLGLGLGADDYVVKPFSPREVIARVKAQLRRYDQLSVPPAKEEGESKSSDNREEILSFKNIEINRNAYTVKVNGRQVEFTTKEFEVLRLLAVRANQVLTRQQIYDHVWGMNEYGDLNTVTIHIKKIRQKIEENTTSPKWIQTVWGVGYKFVGDKI